MNTTSKRWAARIGVVAVMGLAAVAHIGGTASGGGWSAKAVLPDDYGFNVCTVKFYGGEAGSEVKVELAGVTAGLNAFHGLHLHANPDTLQCDPATGFANVGGHWNPTMAASHGQHAGDLPSVLVQADGTGTAKSVTGRFEPSAIGGRAVILHLGADNFANVPSRYVSGQPPVAGPDGATMGTGDAGGRIACGVIVLD